MHGNDESNRKGNNGMKNLPQSLQEPGVPAGTVRLIKDRNYEDEK